MADMAPNLLAWLLARRDFVPRRMVRAAQAFIQIEASSGIVLLFAALVALAWGNSPWDNAYFDLWQTHIAIDTAILDIDLSLQHWVNDGLMTVFFFLVGLEIKRELVHGELSSPRRALLPAAAALGGMIAPAAIYTLFNLGGEGARGWGIPMATDIAFALGVLSLLSGRIPFSVKVFLLALAIADDIGAILVIAVFYSSGLDTAALAVAAAILAGVVIMNRAGVRPVYVYLVAGVCLWLAVFESGIHATLTGVALGLLTPATPHDPPDDVSQIDALSPGIEAPLDRLERRLHPWVSYAIVPLFALANAGVLISGDVARDAISSPVTQGVVVGLLIGKPAGIVAFTWLACRLGVCELPWGASWTHVAGVGLLGGIGFTVSLLITSLAFEDAALVDAAKLGVLGASVIAGLLGFVFLGLTSRHSERSAAPPASPDGPG
jgi:Na+:H+ antiporter, NhaA family